MASGYTAYSIREATLDDVPAIARIHVDGWRETYAGIVPADHLESLTYEEREKMWSRGIPVHAKVGTPILVAEHEDGSVSGFAVAGRSNSSLEAYDAELFAIYVRSEHQGRGIGTALVAESAERLVSAGFRSMMLWVLRDNPMAGFYEHLGGHRITSRTVEIGNKPLPEIAFGWKNLRALADRLKR